MDKKTRTTITLNGRRYDALSGQPFGSKAKKFSNIDGVVKRRSLPHSQTNTEPVIKQFATKPAKPAHRLAKNVTKRPETAKTLMRTAVIKPDKSTRLLSKALTPLDTLTNTDIIKKYGMVNSIDFRRAKRAKTFQLSSQINRFGATVIASTRSSNVYRQLSGTNKNVDDINTNQTPAKKDVWARAIEQATSHEQPKLTKKELKHLHGPKPRKHKLAKYTATLLIGLLVLSYGIYTLMPTVMTKIASVDAGFAASLPGYNPSGFRLASINYQPGQVAFNYQSNIDSRNFKIIENSSTWDSATLVSSIIKPSEGKNYKTLLVRGMNVYIYGNNQASWVSNGILFQISGNNTLSTNQIVQLATTL